MVNMSFPEADTYELGAVFEGADLEPKKEINWGVIGLILLAAYVVTR